MVVLPQPLGPTIATNLGLLDVQIDVTAASNAPSFVSICLAYVVQPDVMARSWARFSAIDCVSQAAPPRLSLRRGWCDGRYFFAMYGGAERYSLV